MCQVSLKLPNQLKMNIYLQHSIYCRFLLIWLNLPQGSLLYEWRISLEIFLHINFRCSSSFVFFSHSLSLCCRIVFYIRQTRFCFFFNMTKKKEKKNSNIFNIARKWCVQIFTCSKCNLWILESQTTFVKLFQQTILKKQFPVPSFSSRRVPALAALFSWALEHLWLA